MDELDKTFVAALITLAIAASAFLMASLFEYNLSCVNGRSQGAGSTNSNRRR